MTKVKKEKKYTKKEIFLFVVRFIAFVLCFMVSISFFSLVITPKAINGQNAMLRYVTHSYRGEKANSIDAFFVGNSDVYRAVSPQVMWQQQGIASCVSGKGKQSIDGTYKILKKMYIRQKPSVVFIEVDMVFGSSEKSIRDKAKREVNTVKSLFADLDNSVMSGISYQFPIFKYHDRWHDISLNDIRNYKSIYKFSGKGFYPEATVNGYNGGFKYMGAPDAEPKRIKQTKLADLDKIVKLCRKHSSRVVFLEVPSAASWSYARHNAIAEYASANNIDFIDLNIEGTVADFDWTTDTKDGGDHLNISGAKKVSTYLSGVLSQNYGLADNRNNDKYKKWNELFIGKDILY